MSGYRCLGKVGSSLLPSILRTVGAFLLISFFLMACGHRDQISVLRSPENPALSPTATGGPTCSVSALAVGASSFLLYLVKSENTASWSVVASDGSTLAADLLVSPTATTSYEFTVTGADKLTGTCSVTINVTPPAPSAPTCASVQAAPSQINRGSSAALSASYSADVTTVKLNGNAVTLPLSVSPTTNASYTLTVTNGAGLTTICPATSIVVNEPPACTSANAAPSTITAGSSTQLTATYSADVTAAKLNGSTVTLPYTDSPAASTTYTLQVKNAAGLTANCPIASVTVNPVPTVPTCSNAHATSSVIHEGNSTQLDASVPSGATVKLNGTAITLPYTVSPTVDSSYTMTVTTSGGTVSCSAIPVAVIPKPPVCNSVTASPETIYTGEASKLSISASTDVVSYWLNGIQIANPHQVAPTGTTGYGIIVKNAAGVAANCPVVVVNSLGLKPKVLTFTATGEGTVVITGAGKTNSISKGVTTLTFPHGTEVTVTANAGYVSYVHSITNCDTSAGTSASYSCKISLTSDRAMTATFAYNTLSIKVGMGAGSGQVGVTSGTPLPIAYFTSNGLWSYLSYYAESFVEIIAKPASGKRVHSIAGCGDVVGDTSRWYGNGTNWYACNAKMRGPRTILVNFY